VKIGRCTGELCTVTGVFASDQCSTEELLVRQKIDEQICRELSKGAVFKE
jgi:hypothetical protein